MISILPSDAIIEELHGFPSRYYASVDWWVAYQWFCQRLREWQPRNTAFEILNATSGVGDRSPKRMSAMSSPLHRLAYLFKLVEVSWTSKPPRAIPCPSSAFLAHLNICNWSDLAKPIQIHGRRPHVFPCREWFDMRGRFFKRPGPNDCHPDAIWVQGFSLQFHVDKKRWRAAIEYGYPHDSSSWFEGLMQEYRESLDRFAARINAWLDNRLEPDEPCREEKERRWNRVYHAMRELFYAEWSGLEKEMVDLVAQVDGTSLTEGRIRLTKSRLTTLKRWMKGDEAKRKDQCGPTTTT